MPQFAPGAVKTAIAPIVAKPSGMACEAELFLGPDAVTKVVTSGRIPFVSTGAAKNVSLPITLPPSPGTYHGYIDVFAGGLHFLAYILTEDVIIQVPALPFTYTFACTYGTCPSATAYGIAQMSGTIKNNNSVPVSQNVKVMWSRWSKTYGQWMTTAGIVPLSPCMVNPFPVSLAPGAQRSFSYQGYCTPETDWTPCIPSLMKNYNYYFWIEDDAGGKSNEVVLST